MTQGRALKMSNKTSEVKGCQSFVSRTHAVLASVDGAFLAACGAAAQPKAQNCQKPGLNKAAFAG